MERGTKWPKQDEKIDFFSTSLNAASRNLRRKVNAKCSQAQWSAETITRVNFMQISCQITFTQKNFNWVHKFPFTAIKFYFLSPARDRNDFTVNSFMQSLFKYLQQLLLAT